MKTPAVKVLQTMPVQVTLSVDDVAVAFLMLDPERQIACMAMILGVMQVESGRRGGVKHRRKK